jgi:hypothetical protein
LNKSTSKHLIKWILTREDKFTQVAFLFLSKQNAINARFHPLISSSKKIRIVYVSGISIRYFDQIIMKISTVVFSKISFRLSQYSIIHTFSIREIYNLKHQVLHFDDPTYTSSELISLTGRETDLNNKSLKSYIITTNAYTKSWLDSNLKLTKTIVIEQGYHKNNFISQLKKEQFICGYSSNYIHYGTDKHSKHSTWGADLLISKIIPEVTKSDPTIMFYLIGKVGKCAAAKLQEFSNVKCFGKLSFYDNLNILSNCSIGLYPREFDHKRSVLKIFTYIGSSLPIVTFDLIDTNFVKLHKLGVTVKDADSFIEAVLNLRGNPYLLNDFKENIMHARSNYTWENLALKMDNFFQGI